MGFSPRAQGGPGSVRFGYGSCMERLQRFQFSVLGVPLRKGDFCVSVQFNREGRFRFRFWSLKNGSGGSGSASGSWKNGSDVPVRFLGHPESQGPLSGGGSNGGGFPDLDLSFLSCPFCPFLRLSRGFSRRVRRFSRFVLFLFLGPIRLFPLSRPINSTYEEQRNSPERVRNTIRTFPEKNGNLPGLETPRFTFSLLEPCHKQESCDVSTSHIVKDFCGEALSSRFGSFPAIAWIQRLKQELSCFEHRPLCT